MTTATLIADVGGTHARLALVPKPGEPYEQLRVVETRDFRSLAEAGRTYLAEVGVKARQALIAGAGPVVDGRIALTNCPWVIDADELTPALGLQSCRLFNDFEALAHCLPLLGEKDVVKIGGGKGAAGAPRLILGPGTGFGAALLVETSSGTVIVPTEAGHMTLGTSDVSGAVGLGPEEFEDGRLTVEAILSGRGIVKLYRWASRAAGEPPIRKTAADIVEAALEGACIQSRRAVELFCALLGAAAGDIALAAGARGGVTIAGGIAPRLLRLLQTGPFRRHFDAKTPMADYMRAIPVFVVIEPQPALLGLTRLVGEKRKKR